MDFSNYKSFIRSFLEGDSLLIEHGSIEGDPENIRYVINILLNKRKIGIIERLTYFQPFGVGYYNGNVNKINKKMAGMLSDIEKRQFINVLIIYELFEKIDLECLCIIKNLIERGVQIVFVGFPGNINLGMKKLYIKEEIKNMIENQKLKEIDNSLFLK